MAVKGQENLVPMNKRTKAEQRKIAKKGGEASGKARRERKTLRESLEALLESGDVQSEIIVAIVDKAKKGDTKAFEIIRDTIGEKPVDKVAVATMEMDKLKEIEDYLDEDNDE